MAEIELDQSAWSREIEIVLRIKRRGYSNYNCEKSRHQISIETVHHLEIWKRKRNIPYVRHYGRAGAEANLNFYDLQLDICISATFITNISIESNR